LESKLKKAEQQNFTDKLNTVSPIPKKACDVIFSSFLVGEIGIVIK